MIGMNRVCIYDSGIPAGNKRHAQTGHLQLKVSEASITICSKKKGCIASVEEVTHSREARYCCRAPLG